MMYAYTNSAQLMDRPDGEVGDTSTVPTEVAWRCRLPKTYYEECDRTKCVLSSSARNMIGHYLPKRIRLIDESRVSITTKLLSELGIRERISLPNLLARIDKSSALRPCPSWVGPNLRLTYLDQREGDVLHIAMSPVLVGSRQSYIFTLRRRNGRLHLDADLAGSGLLWYPDSRWVFVQSA